jgi:hypothetical protein
MHCDIKALAVLGRALPFALTHLVAVGTVIKLGLDWEATEHAS